MEGGSMSEKRSLFKSSVIPRSLFKGKRLFVIGMCSLTLLSQEGCTAMPTNSATNDVLRFKEHVMYAQRYSASQMEIIYGKRSIYRSVYPGSRPEVIREKTPADEKRDEAGSGQIGLRAFEGPLHVKWRSLDGEPHEALLNLEDIFKDRVVLH